MGQLHDYCLQVEEHIQQNGMDLFRTRGKLAMKVGFLISLIGPDEPDDPEKIRALKAAAQEVLGLDLV